MLSRIVIYFRVLGELFVEVGWKHPILFLKTALFLLKDEKEQDKLILDGIEKYHKPSIMKAPSKNQLKPPKRPRKQHPKKQKPFTLSNTHKTTRRNKG